MQPLNLVLSLLLLTAGVQLPVSENETIYMLHKYNQVEIINF